MCGLTSAASGLRAAGSAIPPFSGEAQRGQTSRHGGAELRRGPSTRLQAHRPPVPGLTPLVGGEVTIASGPCLGRVPGSSPSPASEVCAALSSEDTFPSEPFRRVQSRPSPAGPGPWLQADPGGPLPPALCTSCPPPGSHWLPTSGLCSPFPDPSLTAFLNSVNLPKPQAPTTGCFPPRHTLAENLPSWSPSPLVPQHPEEQSVALGRRPVHDLQSGVSHVRRPRPGRAPRGPESACWNPLCGEAPLSHPHRAVRAWAWRSLSGLCQREPAAASPSTSSSGIFFRCPLES